MQYAGVTRGAFVARDNRFRARVCLDGTETVCHVKNTGRLRELLLPGAEVALVGAANPQRKTAYDLVAVRTARGWVNIDSQAPNALFAEWVQAGRFLPGVTALLREVRQGDSRLDFCVHDAQGPMFVEVNHVTLFDGDRALFPDAPTQRGIRHLQELSAIVRGGGRACVFFAVQGAGLRVFAPNPAQAAFADALRAAAAAGVQVRACNCTVQCDAIALQQEMQVQL